MVANQYSSRGSGLKEAGRGTEKNGGPSELPGCSGQLDLAHRTQSAGKMCEGREAYLYVSGV